MSLSASMEVNAHLNDQIERLATEYDAAQRAARDLEKRIRALCRELKEQRERADDAERFARDLAQAKAAALETHQQAEQAFLGEDKQEKEEKEDTEQVGELKEHGQREHEEAKGEERKKDAEENRDDVDDDVHGESLGHDAEDEDDPATFDPNDPAALEPMAPSPALPPPPPAAVPVVSPWLQASVGSASLGDDTFDASAGLLGTSLGQTLGGSHVAVTTTSTSASAMAASSPWLQASAPESTPSLAPSAAPASAPASLPPSARLPSPPSSSLATPTPPAPPSAPLSALRGASGAPSRDDSPSSGGSGWAVVGRPSQTPASTAATTASSAAAALSGRVDWPTLRARGESAGWLVDARDVTLGPVLGAGTFGQTHAGTWLGGNVAVKCVRLADDEAATVFAREVGALSAVRHPNVMALFGAVVEPPQRCWIVCERLDGGTLAEWLHGPRVRYGAAGNPYAHPMPPAPPFQGHLLAGGAGTGNGARPAGGQQAGGQHPNAHAAPATGAPPPPPRASNSNAAAGAAATASSVAAAASSWFGGAIAAVSAAAANASASHGAAANAGGGSTASSSKGAPSDAAAAAKRPFSSSSSSSATSTHPSALSPPPSSSSMPTSSSSSSASRVAVSTPNRSSRARRLRAALDVARGMQALEQHDPPILHRDLKPSNIFLDDRGLAKVADLGLARALDAAALGGDLTGETGTYAYMSPENVRHELYTSASDVWSWGVLAVECLTRQRPYSHLHATPVQIAIEVSRGNLKPLVPTDAPRDLQMLLNACFEADPDARPTFGLVVAHLQVIVATMEAEEAKARANAKWWDPTTIASRLGVGA